MRHTWANPAKSLVGCVNLDVKITTKPVKPGNLQDFVLVRMLSSCLKIVNWLAIYAQLIRLGNRVEISLPGTRPYYPGRVADFSRVPRVPGY